MNKVTLKNGKTYGLVNPLRHGDPVVRAFNADTQRWVKSAKVLEEVIAAHVEQSHTEALEKNAVIDEQIKPKNYGYRPIFRIMSAVERKMFLNFAHDEALEINQKMDTWAQVSDLMVKHTTPYAMDAVHAEALEMDAKYQRAIATIADNLSMPVWDGCSDTVKAEVVKHHHAEALEEDYRFHRLKARWWDFWASYSESERQDELEEAHVEALEMNKAHSL